nr:acyl-CoA dehydrogenase family protein [Defluviimonas salinarum]
MCLSELQADSSLGDIRTTAIPKGDGTWSLTGNKMWISGGDQAITDNIVHMMLARIPDAPAGSKGISLFRVPKMLTDAEGGVTASNNVALAGLNHKMGQRGTTNCLLNFGETGETLGWMIGEPNRGRAYMFQMMNEARIGVGHAATMAGLAGYLHSVEYARTRPQGRRLGASDPAAPQVPIIEHTDVRRMLLAQKAAVEGSQALCMFCAKLVDDIASAADPTERDHTEELLGLLTPVVKSWPSEHCLEANKWAIQILGGSGYTRDYPLERLYRDNRLNHIHDGTFGIQGLDLVGRKIRADGARTLWALTARIRQAVTDARRYDALTSSCDRLDAALATLDRAVSALLGCADPER